MLNKFFPPDMNKAYRVKSSGECVCESDFAAAMAVNRVNTRDAEKTTRPKEAADTLSLGKMGKDAETGPEKR